MAAVLIGGMDRLYRQYMEAAAESGITLKVFNGQERSIEKQLGAADFLILCTAKVSHSAKKEVLCHAKRNGIPVRFVHSAGVSSLRCCLSQCAGCPAPCVGSD
ncbi:MAG: DUF2325 domain-containing protein [Spirochaetaceae bacterium]|jgi:hypothetical protein|nr:DUF2325 domain-containing protein [Spirochaetaceae bacterium]